MQLMIDKRIKRFVEGVSYNDNNDIVSIHLKDIDEVFWFNNNIEAQNFLNTQATERVYDKQLRKGYFDYQDEYGDIHRYIINGVSRGEITSFSEKIVACV